MNWHDVQTAWHDLADQIQAAWPEARAIDLARIAGDKPSFAHYIAKAHDLTYAEAEDAIEDWLVRMYHRRPMVVPANTVETPTETRAVVNG